MKRIFVLFLLMFNQLQFAQITNLGGLNNRQMDSLSKGEISVKLNGKTHYTDYKIITHDNDSIVIDTILTIKKEYKFNFLRKDNFGLMPFHNQGQTFNNLSYNFDTFRLFPDIGFTAKQFNYITTEDVKYYNVPTPTSEIMYRTGQEQGQVLDAFFTANFMPNLNVSLAYKGLRSLGHYRNSLSSSGNFRTTLSYQTPKNQYAVKMHFAKQDVKNQESGGLTPESVENFMNDDPNFTERGTLDTNLVDAESLFEGSRFYLDQNYKLFSSKDSTNTKDFSNLKIGHQFLYEKKEYAFLQNKANLDFFGSANSEGKVNEKAENLLLNNQAYLEFNSKYILGKFKVKANYTNISYGYDDVLNVVNPIYKVKLKGNSVSGGASWDGQLAGFKLKADATIVPGSGHLSGNYFKAEALYQKDSLFTVKTRLSQVSKKPNFNFQLFQSVYDDYNWNTNFSNVATQNLGGEIVSKWGSASADFTSVIDYVYFNEANKPKQHGDVLTYFKLKAEKEFQYGKFALDNTLMYQEVTSGEEVFRVPRFITRNTFYYTDNWFKGDPLLVNIGVTFKYFTKYKMNAYNPLLAEFTLQDKQEIGFPTFDVFFNARVRRTRIFFKLDNVTSFWSEKNYFSAPNYPYRDFSIRFGLVWNWFI